MRVTFTAHPIFLDMIVVVIFGEGYKLWSFHFCSFFHTHVTSCLLCTNVLLSTLFSDTLIICIFLP